VDNNRTGTIGYLQQPAPVVCGGAYMCSEVLHAAAYPLRDVNRSFAADSSGLGSALPRSEFIFRESVVLQR
jgi:hypothetical protein